MNNKLTVTPVTGMTGGESFLVTSDGSAVLVETGYSCSSGLLEENIRKALDGRPLDYILLTHSHYDHAGGTPRIKAAWPDAKVVATVACANVFTRPGALNAMREMEINAAEVNGFTDPGPDMTSKLAVDITCTDGDVIRTGDLSIRVVYAPGHTRCCTSYLFEEDSLMVATESTGIDVDGEIQPTFMVSYKDALDTIDSLERIAPKYILLPHFRILNENESERFPAKAKKAAIECADFVMSRHEAGLSLDDIFGQFVEHYYNEHINTLTLRYPLAAFVTNMKVMIPRLIAELTTGKI